MSLLAAVMGLAAPNEEAYLQRLLNVQQQDRLAAMALADAPALPQLQWEGDVLTAEPTEAEPLSCTVPSSAPVSTTVAAIAVGNVGGMYLHPSTPDGAHRESGVNPAAVLTAGSFANSKIAGQESPVPSEGAQRRTRRASNRRDSSRSDASGSASLGGSSSGRSETAARIRLHAAAAAKGRASDALEPPTPDQVQHHAAHTFLSLQLAVSRKISFSLGHSARHDVEVEVRAGTHCMTIDHVATGHVQVTTRPQSTQRLVHAVMAGSSSSMTGEELLPPTLLEHEMCVTCQCPHMHAAGSEEAARGLCCQSAHIWRSGPLEPVTLSPEVAVQVPIGGGSHSAAERRASSTHAQAISRTRNRSEHRLSNLDSTSQQQLYLYRSRAHHNRSTALSRSLHASSWVRPVHPSLSFRQHRLLRAVPSRHARPLHSPSQSVRLRAVIAYCRSSACTSACYCGLHGVVLRATCFALVHVSSRLSRGVDSSSFQPIRPLP